ncbi:hypothetical protein N6G95_09650 [Pediococcus inopinatus]|uniref:hypothetical protein n=1 Tax=Pediococcus inopinatus TaxID=114090 RepID=UPI002B257127|nr:hypothetical protein [Pediococcus inopinatus]WPC19467.1 hypothetical protein N6G95_09650 [Pediococcus inopinatus]
MSKKTQHKREQDEIRTQIEFLLDINRLDTDKEHGFDCTCERCQEITKLGKSLFSGRTKFTTKYKTAEQIETKATRQIRILLKHRMSLEAIAQIVELPIEKIKAIIEVNNFES